MSDSTETTGPSSTTFASIRMLFKSGAIVLFATYFDYAISFIGKILIADHLGKVDYGFVSVGIVLVSTVNTVALLGLSNGVSRYLPRYSDKEMHERIISSGFFLIITSSLTISALLFMFSEPIAIQIIQNRDATLVIRVFTVIAPFAVVRSYFYGTVQGLEKTVPKVIVENVLDPVLRITLIGGAVAFSLNQIGGIAAYSIPYVVTGILGLWYLVRRTPLSLKLPTKGVSGRGGMYRELLTFSVPLAVSGAMSMVLSDIDTYFLTFYSNVGSVGVYHVIYPIATILTSFLEAFAFLTIPLISRHHSKDDFRGMRHLYKTVVKWTVALSLPTFLVFVLEPSTVISSTFGAEYAEGGTALAVLSVGFFIHGFAGPSLAALTSMGHNRLVMYDTIIVAAVNVVLNFFLVPKYGLLGAAVATMLSYFVSNALGVVQLYKFADIQPFSREAIVLPVLAIGFFVGTQKFILGDGTSLQWIFSWAVVSSVGYGLVALYIVYGEEEREILRATVERILRK
ncbi:flippase [Haloterrigena sp. SYSU A558-1]|uniref:Flippase n=1 Tax=Haloterrigena gelatinilytica TaxID=2741724 RepID=A0ABX2L6M3_9EURY|nr:flippase [Haloterrigena gelatinilytica]NUC70864.1 flippase [Haloterrigena gelatinilytica]